MNLNFSFTRIVLVDIINKNGLPQLMKNSKYEGYSPKTGEGFQ